MCVCLCAGAHTAIKKCVRMHMDINMSFELGEATSETQVLLLSVGPAQRAGFNSKPPNTIIITTGSRRWCVCVLAFEAAVVGEKFYQGNERGNKPMIEKGGKRIVSMKLLKLSWQAVSAILSIHLLKSYCDQTHAATHLTKVVSWYHLRIRTWSPRKQIKMSKCHIKRVLLCDWCESG